LSINWVGNRFESLVDLTTLITSQLWQVHYIIMLVCLVKYWVSIGLNIGLKSHYF